MEKVESNLVCLGKMLTYNTEHGLLFLRISSDLVPFASHPVCTSSWQVYFSTTFRKIGEFCIKHGFRISMHPDQFVVLNTPDEGVLVRSIRELAYHVKILDLMGLDRTAKVQIHVGGVYGNKAASLERFVENYSRLDMSIRRRLVIENDERLYSVADCLKIHEQTKIPVIFDVFHHRLHNRGESVGEILSFQQTCWRKIDGIPMVDYSSQEPGKRPGAHAEHLDPDDFQRFLLESRDCDFDLMLEIKDKERSAKAALSLAGNDPRISERIPGR